MQLMPTREMLVKDYMGKAFGRPNDILADAKGGLYWSDDLGLPDQQIKSAVYYLGPDGKNVLATDEVAKPNGMVLSPNGRIMYIADGNGIYLMSFDVQADGTLKNKRRNGMLEGGRTGVYPKDAFGRQPEDGLASVADGLAIDKDGRVYVTSSVGVQVITPDGKNLGTIPTTHPLQNIAFAGKDMKSLYIFGNGNMYEVRTLSEGIKGRRK
jgi:gluconolactonase